ncbi:winged helix-turn-helix transcriptional regulator [Pseudofrankia sp. EUN1h]|uniref:winged helix-turn-helix transcriptional regulator n=2 Tax=Pseudofrankia TaxID=2994363 RepID=UPI001F51CD66|nr:helix-turn-helix domain-containing protein [Pseudofrankia sp. EUN1h]
MRLNDMRSESAASEHVRLPPAEFPPYGDFAADCPARVALDLFVSRWTAVVVYALRDGPKRPSLLQAEIGEISHKVLTDTLRRLERVGLIRRHRYAEAPPRVEYELTEPGVDLLEPICALGRWAFRHADTVVAASLRDDEFE